jgi:dTDP-4-dehydrorhamnose reductase
MSDGGPVLVTGAAGFLGPGVVRALVARGARVVGTSRAGAAPLFDDGASEGEAEAVALSLDDGGAAAADLVRRLRPRAVLHLAALADPDACARDPAHARRVNVDATGRLAAAAAAVGAYLVLASTDLVFDGTRPPYGEDDPTGPLGPYMATKAAAEEAVLGASRAFLVARLALMYGISRGGRRACFADQVLARLRRGEATPLFTDQVRTPLLVEDGAAVLAALLERRPAGRVHVGGPERASRFDQGVALARAAGLDPALCVPARMADVPGLSPRPADVSLRTDRLLALLGPGGPAPRGLAAGLAAALAGVDG